MKRIYTYFLLALAGAISTFGQDKPEEHEFKPSGKPFAKIYTNSHTQMFEGKYESAFEITRAYLGYEYKFSKYFSAKINIDVGDPGVGKLQHTAYLKNAYMKFKYNGLTTCFGMISTIQFKLQEKAWGHRYILKSFQDEYKFGSSADIGISAAYQVHDMVSIDAIFMNGEGYKSIQADTTYRAGGGITIKPVKGLTCRGYFDYEKKDEALMHVATYIGYSRDAISAGIEFMLENNNKHKKDHNLTGYSAYASYQLMKELEVFGRYDNLKSNTLSGETDPWNVSKDSQMIMAGVEYSPVKGIKLAPNYKGVLPSESGSSLISWIFLSAEFAF
jgi:predicted porin